MEQIDYIALLTYLENNHEIPYTAPEKETDPAEKARFLQIKERGQEASNILKQIATLCQSQFGLEQYGCSGWLHNSETKTNKYLWVQLKYPSEISSPISISIFVEMRNEKEACFRISLEIKDDWADQEIMDQYHSHLDLPLNTSGGLVYATGSNEWGRPEIVNLSPDILRSKIADGTYRKVQICKYIKQQPDQTNKYYQSELLEAVSLLLPYYCHVLGIEELPMKSAQNTQESSKMIDKNLILYGPPGTGKTYRTANYAVSICEGKPLEEVMSEPYEDVLTRYNQLKELNQIAFTTFHQSYGYEEFIEGIKPRVDEDSETIRYTVASGVFKRFCDFARDKNDQSYVFIIDEINRGNISKIFGELITLIEDTKRDGMPEAASAILPYSGETFSVPKNVYILGTMNTADRSIALMDTALRRRFQFTEMMPDSQVLRSIHADKVEDLDVAKMLDTINKRIAFLYDREHTIGHAFFTKLSNSPTIETLASIFEKSVIPLLQEYFYEDYQKIQLVLGDNGKTDPTIKFIVDEEVKIHSVFKGSADALDDLPNVKYTINADALKNLESYKQIM